MRSDKLCKLFIFLTSILLFSLCVNPLHAQIRCATDESERKRHAEHPELETTEQFERWMQSKISKARLSTLTGRTEAQSYTIPVVVHILHNGEAVGVGANISVAQIQSQIAALNRDYPRHNPDSVNTPAEFKPVAGKIDITFVLAKQDPEGVPTNGITRDIGPKTSYNYDTDNSLIKSYSYWPAEEYLNIWVVPPITSGSKSLLGVAQFPQSSGLPGLEGGYTGRLTDGAIIYYRAFGDNSMGGNFNLSAGYSSGRTVVHEVGHYLGLRHIWGDPPVVSCDGTDYCADTPTQDSPTSGCPVHPAISCSHDKMFQNYMDYTSDVCYNLFTKNQVERMTTVLANSPSRISLLTSKGLFDPTLVANDAGIRKIVTPGPTTCGSTPITPVIQLRNYGSNAVTSVRAQISIGGVVQETKDFTVNLNYLDTVNVAFSAITLPNATANNVLQVTILQTNGGTDANAANNVVSETVATPSLVAVPFVEQFNSTPPTWMIINPDAGKTWQNTTAPYTTSSNKAMYINFYDYDAEFQQDYLLSPVFDLSTAATAILKFDRAYAQFSAAHPDGLRIFVSTDCDINGAFEIFNKAGADLATATTTTTAFAPKSASDWKTETISLTPYLGNAHVQLIFMGVNRNGNNLYLDNVSVTTDSFTDLAIVSLKSPSPVTCDDSPLPTINVANNGSTPISAFTITTIINGGAAINETVSNIDLETGQDIDVILHNWTLKSGNNTIKITLSTSGTDIAPANNILSLNEVVNTAKALIPLRQNFNGDYPEWTLVSPTQQANWTSVQTNDNSKGLSLEYAAFSNAAIGSQAWLVSPTLDLSAVKKAALFFDISYALRAGKSDRLQILASKDCGTTFPVILFDQMSDSLAANYPPNRSTTEKSTSSWGPQTKGDWKSQYPPVNLDSIAGVPEARIAFVVTNGNGNNLYLDNLEFFVDDDPTHVTVNPKFAVYNNFTPYVKVTFNLEGPAPVRMQVVNILGQVMLDDSETQVLNQTYTLNLTGATPGIYIVRLQIGGELGVAKVFIGN